MRKNKELEPVLNKCPCGSKIKGKASWIACDKCSQWWHGSCVNLTKEICGIFRNKNLPFLCPHCIISKITDKTDSRISGCAKGQDIKDEITDTTTDGDKAENLLSSEDCSVVNGSSITEELQNSYLNNAKNVLIIDGIKSPEKFQNSRVIKQEIRKYKGDVKIKYAYQLNRGGIAVHLESESDLASMKDKWPEEAFERGTSISCHEKAVIPRCVLKNVMPHMNSDIIYKEVENQTGVKIAIRRLKYRDSGKPMPIVIATCESFEDLQKILKSKIILNKKSVKIHAYQSKRYTPTRCYNCQEFGHIAAICKKESRCELCAETHTGLCNREYKCVNCGSRHTSGSKSCPVFESLKARLLSHRSS